MKSAIIIAAGFFAAIASANPVPNCDPRQVGHHARRLARDAQEYERTASQTPGYGHLANDADRLQRDAQDLARSAHNAYTCQYLDNEFRRVRDTFQYLRSGQQNVQQHSPNNQMQFYWENVSMSFRSVREEMHGGGGGGGHTIQQTVNCSSHNYQYAACYVNGRVIAARLAQQLSNAGCHEGSSWGTIQNGVWVNKGCRANFLVTLRPY